MPTDVHDQIEVEIIQHETKHTKMGVPLFSHIESTYFKICSLGHIII